MLDMRYLNLVDSTDRTDQTDMHEYGQRPTGLRGCLSK